MKNIFLKFNYSGFKTRNKKSWQKGFVKLTKRALTIYLIIFLAFSSIVGLFLFNPFGSKETKAWYNDSWDFRQSLTATNNTSPQASYQLQIALDTKTLIDAGKLQSDCDDIRITDASDNALTYWTEICSNTTGTNSLFWATVPTLASGSSTFYVYYGNAAATSVTTFSSVPPGLSIGTGRDGSISISSDTNINTADSISGRTCSDTTGGDAVIYTSTANTSAASSTIVLATSPSAGCLTAGDEVLIANLRGTRAANSDVGEYETARVVSISTSTLTLNRGLTNGYDGTTQKIIVQRIPNYTSVTLSNAGTDFFPSDWDTTNFRGGVMAFRANGTVTIAASTNIHANATGYIGGIGGNTLGGGLPDAGENAESYDGSGYATIGKGGSGSSTSCGGDTVTAGYGCRAGGNSAAAGLSNPANGAARGGGGGGGTQGTTLLTGGGGSGGGGGYAGGGGGGGGNVSSATGGTGGTGGATGVAGGGGGGGCLGTVVTPGNGGNAGSAGGNSNCNGSNPFSFGGTVGSGATSASGGGGSNNSAGGNGAGGGGGGLYGTAALTTLFFGSGGGGGGIGVTAGPTIVNGANGADGGGIVLVNASTVTVSGGIQSNGGNANAASTGGGSGGAGAGGSILINAGTATLGSSLVTATGGTANAAASRIPGGGGAGVGRIAVNSSSSTGTTNPAAGSTSTIPLAGAVSNEEDKPVTDDNPVGYWKFDEGQGTTANNGGTAGSAIAGTLENTPTWQTENFCVLGKCLWFDGTSNENVYSADNADLDFTASNNFTISVWAKRNGAASDNRVIIQKSGANIGSTYTGYKVYMDASGDFCFATQDGTNAVDSACTSAVDFDDDKWHQVTAVKAATTSLTLYVDGQQRAQDSSIASTGTLVNSSAFRIGVDGDGTSNEWLGFIDEPRVFPRALTADEAKVQYNLGSANVLGTNTQNMPDALSDGLVGYWKMDETAANSCTGGTNDSCDSSGNGNNGAWTNNTAIVAGKYGNGTSYDGTDDYLNIPSSTNYDSTTGTWSGWFKTSQSVSGVYPLIMERTGSFSNGIFVFLNDTDASVGFQIKNGSATTVCGGSSTKSGLNDGNWHHWAITFDGNNQAVSYVDGQRDGDCTPSASWSFAAQPVRLGETNSGFWTDYNGQHDEIRMYNRKLSGNEVAQLYNWAPGPSAYYKTDEALWNTTSGEVKDSSGNGLNGTAAGNATTTTGGKYSRTGIFDGTGDIVNIADNDLLEARAGGGITIMSWVKTTDSSAGFVGKNSGANSYGIYSTFGVINITFLDGSANGVNDTGFVSGVTDGNWHHIAASFDGANGAWKIYRDGVLANSGTGTATTSSVGSSGVLELGEDLAGSLDEAKMYNYVRTQGQIVEDMNAGHPAPGSPISSTLGHWKFDEGYGTVANNYGSAGSAIPATLTNMDSPAVATSGWSSEGKYNKALSFNGSSSSGDYLNVPHNAALNITGDITMTAWIKKAADNDYGGIMAKTNGTSVYDYDFYICDSSCVQDSLAFYSDTTSPVSAYSTGTITGTDWHHVAVTRIGSTVTFYIDGKPSGSTTMTGSFAASTQPLKIGTDGDGSGISQFNGKIDEPKLYNQGLTADQIKLDMNRGQAQVLGALSTSSTPGNDNASTRTAQSAASEYCVPGDASTCTGPIAEWKLDEGSGSTTNDSSGNGLSGTITNALYTQGKQNKALAFDGNGDIASVPSNALLNVTNITVEAWVYSNVTTAFKNAVTRDDSSSNRNWDLGTGASSSTFRFAVFVGNTQHNAESATGFSTNRWHHLTGTYDGETAKLYVNGILTASNTTPSGNLDTDTVPLIIGDRNDGGDAWDGKVDLVRVFGYARSDAQVAWDYNKGGPIGHWKMDECTGTTINDMSGNSLTGTWSGAGSGQNIGDCDTPGTAWGDGVTGKRNYSLDFDGTDDLVTVASNAIMNTSTLTVSAWTYTTAVTSLKNAISRDDGSTNRDWNLGMGSSNSTYRFALWVGNTQNNAQAATGFSTNAWHHLVGTYDGTTMKLYVDGNLAASTSVSGTADTDTTSIKIGARGTQDYWTGQVDDAKFFNYPLTDSQVKSLYNDGATRYGPVTGAP